MALGSIAMAETRQLALSPRYWTTVAAVTCAYFAAARFGFLLAFPIGEVTAVWPPSGIAFVAYLLVGYRVWPGVFLGAFLANATAQGSLSTAAGIGVGNAIAGAAGVYLVKRFAEFDRELARVRDVLALAILAAALGCTISATNGVTQLVVNGVTTWSSAPAIWLQWWVGDSMGVLLFAPLLLTWEAPTPWQDGRVRYGELAALYLGLCAVCEIAFSGRWIDANTPYRFEYAVFPFVIAAAIRYSQREVATSVVLIATIAIWQAAHGRGPFGFGGADTRLIPLQLFMAVVAITGLTLGAVVAERRRVERALHKEHAELERRVVERTAQLASAYAAEESAHNQAVATLEALRQAQSRLVQQEKLASLAQLVTGVAHEINTPIGVVITSASQLRQELRYLRARLDAGQLRKSELLDFAAMGDELGDLLLANAERIGELIGLFKKASGDTWADRAEVVDLRVCIEEVLGAFAGRLRQAGLQVGVNGAASMPLRTYPQPFIQIVQCLIENTLSHGIATNRAPELTIALAVAGNGARMGFADNGPGMSAEVCERAFEPFFTTRRDLGASGLGLYIAHNLASGPLRGELALESQPGHGTTVTLTIPALDA